MTLSALVEEIDGRRDRESSNLSSHIRLFVFDYYCGHRDEPAKPGFGHPPSEPLRC